MRVTIHRRASPGNPESGVRRSRAPSLPGRHESTKIAGQGGCAMTVSRVVLAAAALVAVITAGTRAQGPPPAAVAIEHVSVIPMDRERVLADQTVLVSGGRITQVGSAAAVAIPAGATRVDGRGRFLIPALAEMHAPCGAID